MAFAFPGLPTKSAFVGGDGLVGLPTASTPDPNTTTPAAETQTAATVSQILGFTAQQQTDTGNAQQAEEARKAAEAQAAGYTAEAGAYNEASTVAAVAGNIQELQTARQVSGTLGAQQAGVANAGFKNVGSSIDILRSSLQQGYLQKQILETQTAQEQEAYLAQASGATAAATAATAAAGAAGTEAAAFTKAGELATGNAAAETTALQQFLGTGTLTPEQQLLLSPLSGNADINKLLTNPDTAPVVGVSGGNTVQSANFGTQSGYAPNSQIMIGGKSYATDQAGRVVIQAGIAPAGGQGNLSGVV